MKRILIAIAIGLLFADCQQNQKPDTLVDVGQLLENDEEMLEENPAEIVAGYVTGLNRRGENISICNAYFGEFNGHTWYVFYDNLAAPAVVHDPLCACVEGAKDGNL